MGPRKECDSEFYKNRMQADSNILGNPQQHNGQSKKYSQKYSSRPGIIGLAKNCPGVPKDRKT